MVSLSISTHNLFDILDLFFTRPSKKDAGSVSRYAPSSPVQPTPPRYSGLKTIPLRPPLLYDAKKIFSYLHGGSHA